MSYKPTIIAFVLAVLGIIGSLLMHNADPASSLGSTTDGAPLLSDEQLPVDKVTRITLVRRGEPKRVFERQGMQWMQVEPFVYPMDRYSMRQLSTVAHEVTLFQQLDGAAQEDVLDDVSLGFDPPEAELDYEWDGGSLRVELGRRGLAGRGYLRLNDDAAILVVNQKFHNRALEMDPREWRDRTMFQNVSVDSDRIERSDGRETLVLERGRSGWQMLEPVRTRVDQQALETLVQTLGGAQSRGFITDEPEDISRFGLEPHAAEFVVESSNDGQLQQQRLRIGMIAGAGTQDRYGIIDGRPVVVRVPAAALQQMFRPTHSLIDPTGSGEHLADVRSMRINGPDGQFVLERDMENWRASSHGNQRVSADAAAHLLSQLTELRAGSVRLQQYPQELEVATVTLLGFGGEPLDTIRIARSPQTNSWALENGDNVLRIFSDDFQLRLTPSDFNLTDVIAD